MVRFEVRSMTGFLVRFESDGLSSDLSEIASQAYSLLPGAEIMEVTDQKPDVLVVFNETNNKSLEVSKRKIVINDKWGGKISLDLWHFLYSVIRTDFLTHELYPVHAVCAGKERMILLMGHTGTGKTTVMMELLNDYDWKIFSGNKTVINLATGMEAVAGTKTITIKAKDLEKYSHLKQTAVSYVDRAALSLDEKYFDRRETVPIAAVCNLKLEPGADRTVKLFHPANMHTLYPFFLDTVYADTILCDGEAVYQGVVPRGVREKLAFGLKKQLVNVPVYSMAGSAEYLAKEISKLI